jgi:hypothetical protein
MASLGNRSPSCCARGKAGSNTAVDRVAVLVTAAQVPAALRTPGRGRAGGGAGTNRGRRGEQGVRCEPRPNTNTGPGGPGRQLADLELRHRRHAARRGPHPRREAHGLRDLPFHDTDQNRILVAISVLAQDLLA